MSLRKFFRGYRKKKSDKQVKAATSDAPTASDDEWEDEIETEATPPQQSSPESGYHHQISESEFTCACCYELMVEPTTLTCGHNFCRSCVARWFLQAKKFQCPECRQPWSGNPQVNYTLRAAIERLFKEHYEERKKSLEEDPSYEETLALFNKQMNELTRTSPVRGQVVGRRNNRILENRTSFVMGIGAACVAFLAWCIFQYFFSSRSELSSQKPVLKWSEDEVAVWLRELGPWTEEELVPAFQSSHIDGHLLMALKEEELSVILQPVSQLHQRAFQRSLFSLRELGIKPPTDVWQYRDMHLGWSMFLLYALRGYPRLSMAYLYFAAYTDCFLPFVHLTCPALEDIHHLSLYTFQFPGPTLGQWIDFLVKWVVFPYVLILQFAWRSGNSLVVTLCVTTTCAICTAFEANNIIRYVRTESFKNIVRKEFRELYVNGRNLVIGMLIWPFIPLFACNLLFSTTVYFMAFNEGNALYKQLYKQ